MANHIDPYESGYYDYRYQRAPTAISKIAKAKKQE